ncbi:hypothetical protein QBC34DRAFT_374230 [Podospora aff. communis PSN243]|uniref:Secreted protein n=1 Tax=Podospora aff. communis PSN243 TaxID=3040156 RepID=A0AAV9H8H9_9PEZI|nr:hypothetical protein QBC34DRAFT_374230 [Podospora aff. communis PSN243]
MKLLSILYLSGLAAALVAPQAQNTKRCSCCIATTGADGLEKREPCPIPWTKNYGEYDAKAKRAPAPCSIITTRNGVERREPCPVYESDF